MKTKSENVLEIRCFPETSSNILMENALTNALEVGLDYFELHHKRVSVALMRDEQICGLNLMYRGLNRPTDVLSFAAREGEAIAAQGGFEFLGDIAISIETAEKQAKDYGHSIQRELAFLVVHGLLHLLGYDHQTDEDEKEMRGFQRKILDVANYRRVD